MDGCDSLARLQHDRLAGRLGRGRLRRPLTLSHIIDALEQLYADEIKPTSGEIIAVIRANPKALCSLDKDRLRLMCSSSTKLVIEEDDCGEFAVLFSGRPGVFVDTDSEHDPYPMELWDELRGLGLLSSLPLSSPARGGNELRARQLPCLEGRSLGELRHIASLAAQKFRAGAAGGGWPSYHASWARGEPAALPRQLQLATWEDVRAGLLAVLHRRTCASPGALMSSSIKALFATEFGLDLDERRFGCRTIEEVLADARLHDVCCVGEASDGQAVVRRYWAARTAAA